MKSDQTIIKKNLMGQLNFITNLLGIKDPNITILDVLDAGTHKEILAKLDYPASKCPHCQGQMAKYDFQKESKIPYLDCASYKILIWLRKRRFRCKVCRKMAVAETSLVKKNHQIATIVKQKISQKLIEKSLWWISLKAWLYPLQEKQADHFFGLTEERIACVNPIFLTVFKTFLKEKYKIINALELPYSNEN